MKACTFVSIGKTIMDYLCRSSCNIKFPCSISYYILYRLELYHKGKGYKVQKYSWHDSDKVNHRIPVSQTQYPVLGCDSGSHAVSVTFKVVVKNIPLAVYNTTACS